MLHIALYEPEIPPNTGNIIRLCANSGCQLHLIHPLGFSLDERNLRRAGLDYHEWAQVVEHKNFKSFLTHHRERRIWACTTKASRLYTDVQYLDEDLLLFGPETRGLPTTILEEFKQQQIRIPMRQHSRSINLANAVAIIAYEALRQIGFGPVNNGAHSALQ